MPYIGQEPITGNFIKLDTISVVNGVPNNYVEKNNGTFIQTTKLDLQRKQGH